MGILKTTENFDIWLLYLACMKAINHKKQAMMRMYNNYPLSTEGKKSPLQPHQCSILKHQVIDNTIDPGELHYLNEWQSIHPVPDGPPPIFVELTKDANATDDEMAHVKKNYLLKNSPKSKNIL